MADSTDIQVGAVTPLIPAGPDLPAAIAFFENKLGFATTWRDDNAAGVRRGDANLVLVRSDDKHWALQTSLRIRVDELEALNAEFRAAGVEDMGTIEAKPWGTQEFFVRDLVGVCYAFWRPASPPAH